MLQILGALVLGSYTVAFRVAAVFTLPITAMINATLPRLIAQQRQEAFSRTYNRMLKIGLGYGAFASIVLVTTAPQLTVIFGADYVRAVNYLETLAAWPILFALRSCIAASLTATGKQRTRTFIEVAAFILALSLNLILLPSMGASAAIVTLLITETAMAGGMTVAKRY